MAIKNFHILTLFPDMFKGPFSESMIKRALEKDIISINFYNLRDYGLGRHKQVDDTPYGGGAGLVMKVDIISNAINDIKSKIIQLRSSSFQLRKCYAGRVDGQENKISKLRLKNDNSATVNSQLRTILLTPQGKRLDQKIVRELAKEDSDYLLICGHYEGFDERIRSLVDEEISIGDYVLTGGELPAMVIVDAVSRLIHGVLGKEESHQFESFEDGLLEYPQYTRPEEFEDKKVPEVLLSGHHAEIEKWRKEEAIKRTKERRKDLLFN